MSYNSLISAWRLGGLAVFVAVTACSEPSSRQTAEPSDSQAVRPSSVEAAKPTGKIIVVTMTSDEKGNYFTPATIDAARGDVIRFTLKTGVHNVSFPHDSNSITAGLPNSSDFLQLPDQEYDVAVNMPVGSYYFHCDPHAALGMKGKLNVR
jgi:plastocyanin